MYYHGNFPLPQKHQWLMEQGYVLAHHGQTWPTRLSQSSKWVFHFEGFTLHSFLMPSRLTQWPSNISFECLKGYRAVAGGHEKNTSCSVELCINLNVRGKSQLFCSRNISQIFHKIWAKGIWQCDSDELLWWNAGVAWHLGSESDFHSGPAVSSCSSSASLVLVLSSLT